jgi:hypothetical protein
LFPGQSARLANEDTIVIDTINEDMLTLTEAIAYIPTHPDIKTLYAWTYTGCKGVVLETITVGSKRCTSKQALQRFYEKLNDPQRREVARKKMLRGRSENQKKKAAIRAGEKLRKAGA